MSNTETQSVALNYEVIKLAEASYLIKEIPPPQFESLVANDDSRKTFSFDVKVFKFSGYLDTKTEEISVKSRLFDALDGAEYKGSLSKGLEIGFDWSFYKGYIRLGPNADKSQFQVEIRYSLFGKQIETTQKLFSL